MTCLEMSQTRGSEDPVRLVHVSLGLGGHKPKGSRVDTVPEPSRGRAIRKNVPKVGVTGVADDFRSDHGERWVLFLPDHTVCGRGREAGPSATGLELCLGIKKRSVTADTHAWLCS